MYHGRMGGRETATHARFGGLPLETLKGSQNHLKAAQEPVGGNLSFSDLCPVDDARLASTAF